MKIKKSQFIQIIKEEAQKVKKEILLRKELASIEKELQDLNEVHAGGAMAPGEGGVHAGQKKAVFTKKGTHLIEKGDEEMADMEPVTADAGPEGESADDITAGIDGADVNMGPTDDSEQTITKEMIKNALASLGQQLDLTGIVDFDTAPEGDMNADLDVDIETGAEDAVDTTDADAQVELPAASGEEESSEEPTDNVDETQTQQQCGDPMAQETKMEETAAPVAEVAAPVENQKLNEEKARWKKLINY